MIALAATFITFVAAIDQAAAADSVPRRPAGITVHDTPAGEVFADDNGLTLYVFDNDTKPGVSACVGECATAWPPVKATADAVAFDDWSLVTRTDGSRQWAHKGKPLYRYALEQKPGWALGDGGGLWNLALTSWTFLQRATGRPASGPPSEPPIALPPVPAGITGQKSAQGPVIADYRGMTLYTFDKDTAAAKPTCTGACAETGQPLKAPMAALPVGDWTILAREDGTRYWAYNQKPVYTCATDSKPGETNCDVGAIGPWHALKVQ